MSEKTKRRLERVEAALAHSSQAREDFAYNFFITFVSTEGRPDRTVPLAELTAGCRRGGPTKAREGSTRETSD